MRIKDLKAKYAELNPVVTLNLDGELFGEYPLNDIPNHFNFWERVRYCSYNRDGSLVFNVWAERPDNLFQLMFGEFDRPYDYFRELCEDMDYNMLSYECLNNRYFKIEYLDKASNEKGLMLFYADLNEDMNAVLLDGACEKDDLEHKKLIDVWTSLGSFYDYRKERIAALKCACGEDNASVS